MNFAIVDIETTGGLPKRDKITEIAIIISDGEKILSQFHTLVNPERSIPSEITRITGITNEMVAQAPKFYEVAAQIVKMTEDCIFVAHNVMFDYGFIKNEFLSLGYNFNRKLLCTVKMSRRMHPWLKSHSLENLIKHFNIAVRARHRALDDALATTFMFHKMMSEGSKMVGIEAVTTFFLRNEKVPFELQSPLTDNLPNETGVYYFKDKEERIIYIGKSKNIKERVKQHLSGKDSKTEKFIRYIKSVDYVLTGSELIALLLENIEIKHHHPEINKALKIGKSEYAIKYYYDQDSYLCFAIQKYDHKPCENILNLYSSLRSAQTVLSDMIARFSLCEAKSICLGQSRSCFSHRVNLCLGACKNEETAESYNRRAAFCLNALKNRFDNDFVLIVNGRTPGEKGLVIVKDGFFDSFEFIDTKDLSDKIKSLNKKPLNNLKDPDANRIIKNYISSHPMVEKIDF